MFDELYPQERDTSLGQSIQRPDPIPESPSFFDGSGGAIADILPNIYYNSRSVFTEANDAYHRAWEQSDNASMKPPPSSAELKHAIIDPIGTNEVAKSYREEAKKYTPDPQSVGFAGQLIHGVGTSLVKAGVYSLTGLAAPALFGADMAANETLKLRDEGVDINTALEAGAVSGVANAAGFMIAPALGATRAASAAWGAGSNIALNVAEIAGIHTLLNHANYKSIAAQYQPLDPTNIIVSGLLGSAFGAAFHKGKVDPVLTPDEHAAALTMNEAYTRNNDTLTHPDDVNSLNAATDAQALARQQLDGGEMVSVADGINIDHATVKDRIASISDDLISIAGNRMTRGERLLLKQQKSDLEYKLKQIEDSDYTQQGLDSAAEHQALLDADNAGRLATTGHREPARKLADQRKAMQESATALGEAVRQEDMQPHHDSLSRLNEMLVKDDEARAAHSEISRLEQQHLLDNGFIQHPEVKPLYEAIKPINQAPTQTLHALVEQPVKVEAVQESPTMDMGEQGFISETTQTIDAKDTAPLADSNEFGDKSDIAMGQPSFKGNKRSMLGMAVNALKTLINRHDITHIDDWFAGGGMWSTSLANAILPNVKSIRLGELNPLRIKRIEWMHERGDKLFEDMQSSGALEVYRKLLEEFKNNKDTDGSAKPIVSPSPFDKIGLELAGFGTGKGVGFDRVRTSGADKLPEQGKVLLSALGDLAFNNRSVKIHKASQMTLPDGTVADKFLAKAITEMAAAHKQAQTFKSRGGKYEYMPAGSSFDSVGSKVIKGKHVLSLADPPYYNTTGYKGAGDFATGDKWNANGYAATHDLLQTLVANDNHILYTDEAWWLKAEQMADKHAAGATLTKINNMLSDLHVAPKQIGNRYEQLGIHNPTHASGQTDSSGLGGKIYAGTAEKGTDGGGRGDDSGRATGPMAEGTGEQSRVAAKLLESPEITSAREALSSMDASRQIEIPNDDGTVDTGTASELMARADEDMAFAEQSDAATTSAISCFLKFGGL